MPTTDSDSVSVAPVPSAAPAVFAGAVVARAAIGSLDVGLADCAGWGSLHADEQAWAADHAPRRAREFVAGRVALRAALSAAGFDGQAPCVPGEQGRPHLPAGFTASITHKDGAALAIARRGASRTLGIDSEVVGPRERLAIAAKVLTAGERLRWDGAWSTLLERFSLKEAIYKALHPHVPRYIGFDEADIADDRTIKMTLRGGEGPFSLVGWWWWEGPPGTSRRLVSICEARPA